MRKALYGIWMACAALAMSACTGDLVYSHYENVAPANGKIIGPNNWHMDSVARFTYTIDDSVSDYRILLRVRHLENYPYQNMWLFVNDGMQTDTIEFYLADDRGRWLGNSHHGFYDMPVLYEESKHYPDTGAYTLEVSHAMRDTLLRGVTHIGVEVRKNKQAD